MQQEQDKKEKGITGLTLKELKALPFDEQKKVFLQIKSKRLDAKKVNFASTYGAGPPKIALTASIPLKEATKLHSIYWSRNKAVKQVANNCITKTVNGQMWLWNPVPQLWYSLRFDKDRFSTLNQGTAVYCFDTWVRKVRSKGIKLCGQFHDEFIAPTLRDTEPDVKLKIEEAIDETNEELKLNITLGVSIDFGESYSDIH